MSEASNVLPTNEPFLAWHCVILICPVISYPRRSFDFCLLKVAFVVLPLKNRLSVLKYYVQNYPRWQHSCNVYSFPTKTACCHWRHLSFIFCTPKKICHLYSRFFCLFILVIWMLLLSVYIMWRVSIVKLPLQITMRITTDLILNPGWWHGIVSLVSISKVNYCYITAMSK